MPAWVAAWVLLASGVAAGAGTTYWQCDPGVFGDWHDPANWTDGLPEPSLAAAVNNGGTAVYTSGETQVYSMAAGAVGSGTIIHTGGTIATGSGLHVGSAEGAVGRYELGPGAVLEAWDNCYIGRAGNGTLLQTGGALNLASRCYLNIGYDGTGVGRYEISGGSARAHGLNVGQIGVGTVEHSGGSLTTSMGIDIGKSENGSGSYSLSGDGEIHAGDVRVGYGGPASFVQTGGLNQTAELYLALGSGTRVVATYDLRGGTLQASSQYIGCGGYGTLTQTGGRNVAGYCRMGYAPTGHPGAYALSGGSLSVTWALSVGDEGHGALEITGASGSITTDEYHQTAEGELICEIDGGGITTIQASGQAHLGGVWRVVDRGAGFGRFDVLTADGGINGMFANVEVPGVDWVWGVEDDRVLWVEHVPEPATLALLAFGGLVLRRRRQSSSSP